MANEPRTSTGRVRARKGWFGRMVLQIEVIETYTLHNGGGMNVEVWRDARAEDVDSEGKPLKIRQGRPAIPPKAPPAPAYIPTSPRRQGVSHGN
jgi:hypothetical protein